MDMRVEWTFLVTLGLALWCACCSTGCVPEDKVDGRDETYVLNAGNLRKVDYAGHTYVLYRVDRGGGIAHDPDCTCGWLGRRRD